MGSVECPRCGRVTEAAGVWLWVDGQGERLRVKNGSIQQSGHVTVFDLACGCKFDTDLWTLGVTTNVSSRAGRSVSFRVTPIAATPAAVAQSREGQQLAEIRSAMQRAVDGEIDAVTKNAIIWRILTRYDEDSPNSYHSIARLPGRAETPGRDGLIWFACNCPIGQDHNIDGRVR